MLSIAICDDELTVLTELEKKINDYMRRKQVEFSITKYLRGEQLLYSNINYDIVLLDIRMNGINGLDTAKKIRSQGKDSHLIFVTGLKEYVFEAFDVSAANYLLKPLKNEKLYATLDRILSRIVMTKERYLLINNGQELHKIKLDEILYCEAANHSTFIYKKNGEEECRRKFEALVAELDADFFQCHRCYIIHFKYVQSYKEGYAYLTSGEKIPVAKRRQRDFMKALLSFQRKEVR